MCTFKVGDVVRMLGGTTSIPEIVETVGKTGVIIDMSKDITNFDDYYEAIELLYKVCSNTKPSRVSFVSDFWHCNFDETEWIGSARHK